MLVGGITGTNVWLDEVKEGVRAGMSGTSRKMRVVLDDQLGRARQWESRVKIEGTESRVCDGRARHH